MSEETKTKEMLRSTERFITKPKSKEATYVKGYWKPIKFHQLKKGDIFRLWENDKKNNRKPDLLVDGRHDVCVAVGDAYESEDSHGVEALSIRGF